MVLVWPVQLSDTSDAMNIWMPSLMRRSGKSESLMIFALAGEMITACTRSRCICSRIFSSRRYTFAPIITFPTIAGLSAMKPTIRKRFSFSVRSALAMSIPVVVP